MLDNLTRWNLKFSMLLTFVTFKEPLKYVSRLTVNNEFKGLFLTTKEW